MGILVHGGQCDGGINVHIHREAGLFRYRELRVDEDVNITVEALD